MKSASPLGNSRDRESIATSAPLAGLAYSRRSVARDRASATASVTIFCATAEGTEP